MSTCTYTCTSALPPSHVNLALRESRSSTTDSERDGNCRDEQGGKIAHQDEGINESNVLDNDSALVVKGRDHLVGPASVCHHAKQRVKAPEKGAEFLGGLLAEQFDAHRAEDARNQHQDAERLNEGQYAMQDGVDDDAQLLEAPEGAEHAEGPQDAHLLHAREFAKREL